MLIRIFFAIFLLFSVNAAAIAEISDQPATKRVRTLADRVGDRALEEWVSAWSEFKTLANSSGTQSEANLIPYMNMGCHLSAVDYWDPKMVWVAQNVRQRNSSGRIAKRSTQQFRRTVADILKAENKRFYSGQKSWMIMEDAMDLIKSAKTKEHDLQQRAEIILLLNISWSSITQLHSSDSANLEYALKSILFHKLGCDFADESLIHLDAFLESQELPLESSETELAMIIISNAISDPALRVTRLQALSNDQNPIVSEAHRPIAQQFLDANIN